jgi:signal transduction histidine kinase
VFLLSKNLNSILSNYFIGIALSFAIWILLILFQWVGVYLEVVHLAWQLLILPEMGIFIFSAFFNYVFLFEKKIPNLYINIFSVLLIFVSLLLPTEFNISAFDYENCEGIVGSLWKLAYIFEWVCLSVIIWVTLKKLHTIEGKIEKLKVSIFSGGLLFFLGIFWASNYFGELTKTYEINLIGPGGMFLFISLLAYLIVRFKIFNIKVFASQTLIAALWFLIAALLFIQRIDYIHIVVLFTLVLVTLLGYNLIKSVKREIEQREKVEKLAKELEQANIKLVELDRQKDAVLHMVAHQFKGPVTTINFVTELLLDGTYGDLTTEQKENLMIIRTASQKMGSQSEMVLNAAKITLGKLPLEPKALDLNELFKEIVAEAEIHAKEKKVDLTVVLPESPMPTVILDRKYTQLAIDNLLSNAVKYTALKTPEGGKVDFTVKVKDKTLFCTVKDTGIGVPAKEKENIFKELYRASNAGKEGNGLGLNVAKGAIESQGGTMWFESEEGVGTTFFVKLPLKYAEAGATDTQAQKIEEAKK